MNQWQFNLCFVVLMGFLVFSVVFFLPVSHRAWVISPAEEYHGWQFVAIDGSVTFWLCGYGLNHRYVYFMSSDGQCYPCDDWGWHLTPYPYPMGRWW